MAADQPETFADVAAWFKNNIVEDLAYLPSDPGAACQCHSRRWGRGGHMPGCSVMVKAWLEAARDLVDDSLLDPPDYSMRVAVLFLIKAYASRHGYSPFWAAPLRAPSHIQEILDSRPQRSRQEES